MGDKSRKKDKIEADKEKNDTPNKYAQLDSKNEEQSQIGIPPGLVQRLSKTFLNLEYPPDTPKAHSPSMALGPTVTSRPTVQSKSGMARLSKGAFRVRPPSAQSLNVSKNIGPQNVPSISEELWAQQITAIDEENLRAIKREELTGLQWTAKDKEKYAPNIVAATRWFNQITFWIQKEILKQENMTKRAEIVSHFIRIAKKLAKLHNYSSCMAVVCGLQMHSIHRLTGTWNLVSSRDRTKFDKLSDLFLPHNNYSQLRAAQEMARLPCLPYLGIYLSDLIFIDTAAKTAKKPGQNDQHTEEQINRLLSEIQRFQSSKYGIVRDESVASYLQSQRYIEELQQYIEQTNYKMSVQLEPLQNSELTAPGQTAAFFFKTTEKVMKPEVVTKSSDAKPYNRSVWEKILTKTSVGNKSPLSKSAKTSVSPDPHEHKSGERIRISNSHLSLRHKHPSLNGKQYTKHFEFDLHTPINNAKQRNKDDKHASGPDDDGSVRSTDTTDETHSKAVRANEHRLTENTSGISSSPDVTTRKEYSAQAVETVPIEPPLGPILDRNTMIGDVSNVDPSGHNTRDTSVTARKDIHPHALSPCHITETTVMKENPKKPTSATIRSTGSFLSACSDNSHGTMGPRLLVVQRRHTLTAPHTTAALSCVNSPTESHPNKTTYEVNHGNSHQDEKSKQTGYIVKCAIPDVDGHSNPSTTTKSLSNSNSISSDSPQISQL